MASQFAIDTLISEKRARHPELLNPLTWPALQRVCAREGVLLFRGPLPADAALVSIGGRHAIVLNSDLPARRHTYRAAHELAHAWLHAPTEPTIYLMSADVQDRREDEAEYVALRLMQGW